MKKLITSLFLVSGALCCGSTTAAPITFTDPGAFLANLPGTANTLNFESQGAGSIVPSGSGLGGITFNYDFGGVQMAVTDGNQYGGGGPWDTTSGSQFLGSDDGDLLQDGDDFGLSFGPVNAIGLYFITIDAMFDDDIILTAAGISAGLLASSSTSLPDGGEAYFLGIIDDSNSFTSAEVSTIGGGFFFYNVDDIVTAVAAVPVPGSVLLLLAGLSGLIQLHPLKKEGTGTT